jgi:hypothetical protein
MAAQPIVVTLQAGEFEKVFSQETQKETVTRYKSHLQVVNSPTNGEK